MQRLIMASVGLGFALGLTGQALADSPASPNNQGSIGETTYFAYCALCHGTGGAPGMFADALKKAAPDLTEIAKRNGGKFPDERVTEIIRNGGVSGHGTMRLLSWEKYFRREVSEERADQIIHELTEYLKNHQAQ
jgi:mono/diheme cytochrome c family protein